MNFYFYPRPPRGGRPARNRQPRIRRADFYPRPPRGGRPATIQNEVTEAVFLSTPSARRATLPRSVQQPAEEFLSTPSARRATFVLCILLKEASISIHALREEGDPLGLALLLLLPDFYPRPPRGGRPRTPAAWCVPLTISIHALREEGDAFRVAGQCLLDDFYPRPPRGGRRYQPRPGSRPDQFLSTPSARRATRHHTRQPRPDPISIHALREEGDWPPRLPRSIPSDFYPRPPRGGRPPSWTQRPSARRFLSTPSARRATCDIISRDAYARLFLSTPSARRATAKTETKALFSNKLYNILHEFRRALIYNWSKNYPNRAK